LEIAEMTRTKLRIAGNAKDGEYPYHPEILTYAARLSHGCTEHIAFQTPS
jgi:hypothetical protein